MPKYSGSQTADEALSKGVQILAGYLFSRLRNDSERFSFLAVHFSRMPLTERSKLLKALSERYAVAQQWQKEFVDRHGRTIITKCKGCK